MVDWNVLIVGRLTREEIDEAVKDNLWQRIRISMKGEPLEVRYGILEKWLKDNGYSRRAWIQVTNYVNALKRGGMIK